MIIQEIIFDDLVLSKSDSGFTIIQNETGLEYDEAIDVMPLHYTYKETTNKVEGGEEEDV